MTADPADTTGPADPTAIGDLHAYQAIPRLAGLALSLDGTRLVTGVSAPDPSGARFRTALWEIDPAGERPARQLTRGASASSPVFTPGGDLLFTAARPDPDAKDQEKDGAPAALWRLPVMGEAAVEATRPGGISAPVVARRAGTVLVTSPTLPGSVTAEDDEARRAARRDGKITAILHAGHPVRFWDHDLGPDEPRLLVDRDGTWADLTPAPGPAALGPVDVTPDGRTAVAQWREALPRGDTRHVLVTIDIATGERRVLLALDGADVLAPVVSPDGTRVACLRETWSAPDLAPDVTLLVVPLGGASVDGASVDGASVDRTEPTAITGWDRWPAAVAWTPDGTALIVTADEGGRAPVFRVTPGAGVVRLTADDGAYTDLQVGPDAVYALRSAIDAPPAPVRLDPVQPDQQPVFLRGPAAPPNLPGSLTEVTATADDGSPLRAWLVHPGSEAPAPLLLWVHGGPLSSWNAWQWRWNPWLMAARGYAVLLPDPALSTGYGRDFVQRGWSAWGDVPYTDLLALTDAACAHPDVDATRTAAMGGSFGGYMANWIAGHTDRFQAIVTHAGLWELPAFGRNTDGPQYWAREMTREMTARHSPHAFADAITTPMLVIHGDKDYRVPIGEALALWWDLVSRHDGDPADLPHRFLYYPDENHWILAPHHAVLWYETVLAFLDHHVRDGAWVTPDLLR